MSPPASSASSSRSSPGIRPRKISFAPDSVLEERRLEPSVPPEAIYTELVFKTLFTRWKTRNTDPFRGAASAVDCRGTGGYQRLAAESSQGMDGDLG